MLDWHSCQICYPLEIKILLLLLYDLKFWASGHVFHIQRLLGKPDIRMRFWA